MTTQGTSWTTPDD